MADFTKIETQEQLDAILGERLKRADEKWAKKYEGFISPEDYKAEKTGLEKKINDLTAALDGANKKYEGFDKQLAERDATIQKYETASVKSRVAHEVGLSYDAIQFLQGTDEDSIRASADGLKSLMGSAVVPPVSHEPVVEKEGDTRSAFRKMARDLGSE